MKMFLCNLHCPQNSSHEKKLTMRSLAALCTLCSLVFINPVFSNDPCYYDNQAPIAICDGHTVVALGSNGTAKLYATTLDDGSYDNCGIKEFKVARMTPGWCPYGVIDDTQFRSFVEFCCEDIGYPIWVIFRVIDWKGNYNDCMVEVTVQDKLPPTIHCPYDKTIYCDYWYDPDELYNPWSSIFGDPVVHDNCGLEGVWVDVYDNTSCGIGHIKRKFTAVDWGGKTAYCFQNIWVKDHNPFKCYSITWPWDYQADACHMIDVDPHKLPYGYDKPRFPDDNCSLIGVSYKDQVFYFEGSICTKILRTWTVIDWCKFDPYNPYHGGICEHIQIIKLFDHDKPHFSHCKDVTVEGLEPHCKGRVILDPGAYDYCTPHHKLDFEYKIDIYANGSTDIIRHDKPVLDEILPIGTHKVLWFVDDGCGNLNSCSYKVTVVDKKPPTPVCYYQLSTVVMPIGGMVTIWAKDFDASSFDNCTKPEHLKFSFSSNVYEKSRNFICDDVGINELQVWVTDGSGNQAYCTTYLTLADNDTVCADMYPIQGLVETFSGTPVEEAEVALYKVMNDESMLLDMMKMSDDEGTYQVGFGTTQFDRAIDVNKSDNLLTGISALDMVFLQQHIFGINTITEPAALYAADIDGSGHVGVNDLIMLRDAFLSGGKSLENVTMGWLFYPEECPWNTDLIEPECDLMVSIDKDNPPTGPVNFLAVKKGDINGDVLTDLTIHAGSNALVGLEPVEDAQGSVIRFRALQDMDASGLQLSLSSFLFNQTGSVHFASGTMHLGSQNYYVDDEDELANVVWLSSSADIIREGDVLFTARITHSHSMDITRAIKLRGAYRNEIYSADRVPFALNMRWMAPQDDVPQVPYTTQAREGLAEQNVNGGLSPQMGEAGYNTRDIVLGEVEVAPNPMRESTVITLTYDRAAKGTFEVFGADHRQIIAEQKDVVRGVNKIHLQDTDLAGPGIYYFRIVVDGQAFEGKIAHMK